MTITNSQRTRIMQLWQKACKERGWKASDRDFRLEMFSEMIGRTITSTDEVERLDECTKLMNELRVLMGVSVRAGLEVGDPALNQARVLRNQILTEIIPCLEVYVSDVRAYLTEIMADKNRWWKIDRPECDITIMDLDAKPIIRRDRKTGEIREFPSQLKQIQYTLSARMNSKRKEAGHTIHEMKVQAGVPCTCAECSRVAAAPEMIEILPPLPPLADCSLNTPSQRRLKK